MKYLVMECHPSYAVLLDEEGRFVKAANLHYEVGQTVESPFLMREAPAKKRHTARLISGIAALAACLLLALGIGYYQNYLAPYSSIFLSINPEVRMELNRQGTVVNLTGTNEDGVTLLEGYQGKGKDKVTVADELIDRAIEMGFLSEGGQVSFSIDTPDDLLFQQYGEELRSNVTEYLDDRLTVIIEINGSIVSGDDYDDEDEDDDQDQDEDRSFSPSVSSSPSSSQAPAASSAPASSSEAVVVSPPPASSSAPAVTPPVQWHDDDQDDWDEDDHHDDDDGDDDEDDEDDWDDENT